MEKVQLFVIVYFPNQTRDGQLYGVIENDSQYDHLIQPFDFVFPNLEGWLGQLFHYGSSTEHSFHTIQGQGRQDIGHTLTLPLMLPRSWSHIDVTKILLTN